MVRMAKRSIADVQAARAEWLPLGKKRAGAVLRRVVSAVRRAVRGGPIPSVTEISRLTRSPFRILVSTVISARTKDEVTSAAAKRLFARASSPQSMAALGEEEISALIYPAGFYRTKAKALRALSTKLIREFGGRVPDTMDGLLSLPGVGRKTANLVLGLGFGIPAICVDTHVHRIVNRLGIVQTRFPVETERALRAVLERRFWLEINDLLVTFGKTVCTPLAPRCSICPIRSSCRRVGVGRSR
jgi:endonuclease-3